MKKNLIPVMMLVCTASYSQINIDKDKADALQSINNNCSSSLNAVTAVTLKKERRTTVIFNNNGGVFDPSPLLTASVNVKENSCIIIHFSANTYIADNSVVYQVRMDGKPVEGHITSVLPAVGNTAQPIIIVADEDGQATKAYHPVSYTFFGKASPGNHKIEVMVAGCCSANTSGSPVVVADNATLIVQYNKN